VQLRLVTVTLSDVYVTLRFKAVPTLEFATKTDEIRYVPIEAHNLIKKISLTLIEITETAFLIQKKLNFFIR
jgi:hypothetical protein